MPSLRSLPVCSLIVLLSIVDVPGADAQQDSAFNNVPRRSLVAKVRHDRGRWSEAVSEVEGDELVRVEVPRALIDPKAESDLQTHEWVRLGHPVSCRTPSTMAEPRSRVAGS